MKKSLMLILLFLVFAIYAAPAHAEDPQIQIFSLKHRSATEAVEKVRPLLNSDERLSATDNHLVLIAAPQTIEAVTQLISTFDHPASQYRVQVRWLEGVTRSSGRIGYDHRAEQATLSGGSVLGTSQRQTLQQLRVAAGETGYILTGKEIPYNHKWAAWSGQDSSGYASQIAFQQVRSGFLVKVEPISGRRIRVELTPQLMGADGGGELKPSTLVLDRLTTRVQLQLGTWLDLGSSMPNRSAGLELLSGQEDALAAGRRLQIRIDPGS